VAIHIGLHPDFREVDATINRLITAMSPKMVNSLATRVARKQVKGKYAERFRTQTNSESNWQERKREAALGEGRFPYGPEPGFLTGTTFNSITAESGQDGGKVFLKGMWPQGSGHVSMRDESNHVLACFKWSTEGLEFLFSDMARPKYPPPQKLDTIDYTSEGGRKIEWMYLDDQDVDMVTKSVENLLLAAAENNPSLTKSLFEETRMADGGTESLASAERDAALFGKEISETPEEAMIRAEGSAAAANLSESQMIKNLEAAGYVVAEQYAEHSVNNVFDLIRKLQGF